MIYQSIKEQQGEVSSLAPPLCAHMAVLYRIPRACANMLCTYYKKSVCLGISYFARLGVIRFVHIKQPGFVSRGCRGRRCKVSGLCDFPPLLPQLPPAAGSPKQPCACKTGVQGLPVSELFAKRWQPGCGGSESSEPPLSPLAPCFLDAFRAWD